MRVTIIADASYCPDTKGAGYGIWIAAERGKWGGGGEVRDKVDSSSAAEMIAIVNAVFIAVGKKLVRERDHILLQTDCQSAIDAFIGSRSNLTKDEKSAKKKLLELKREHSFTFSFRHVKGHTTRPEARYVTNKLCDSRARAGMKLARRRFGGLTERNDT